MPQDPAEYAMTVVKNVGTSLGMQMTDTMVNACHRLRKNENLNGPPVIIVKFVRRIDKEEILKKMRV